MDLIKIAENAFLGEPRELPSFHAGDTITVRYKIVEGAKERIQNYKGTVIQIKGTGTTKTETGLSCGTSFTRYVWAYGACGISASTPLTQLTEGTVASPDPGINIPSLTQIEWNWNTVTDAEGYKWNTTDEYASATDMGTGTTKTETGLSCGTSFTRYVWALWCLRNFGINPTNTID